MQNSCVKLVTKDKVITTVLPVKAIQIMTTRNNATELNRVVYFIFSPFSLN